MIVVNARFLTQSVTGVQRYAIEISRELKKVYHVNIVFVCPRNIMHQEIADKLDAKIIGKHTGHLWEQLDLPLYLKRHGTSLLLCLCNMAPLFYKNKIVTIHDVAYEVYPQTFNKLFLYTYRFMIPRIIKSAKKVITVSEFSKSEIVKYYGTDSQKIVVVYNAVSSDFHKVEDKQMQNNKYILAVSSLNYRKNFIAVLEAFKIFQKGNNDVSLYIIGDLKNANFASIDTEQYKEGQRVRFLGRVSDEDLMRYYSNAAAFVYPSIYEGFGIPPLEAQKCGCPVLVSDIPPLHEVVNDSAIYCNPYDVNDIVKGLARILASSRLYEELGLDNVRRFSWKVSAEKVTHIISSMDLSSMKSYNYCPPMPHLKD